MEPPIQRLAPELLGLIFIECLPEAPTPISCMSTSLTLANVCRKWRAIAQSIPQLWSPAHVKITINQKELNSSTQVAALERRLQRMASTFVRWFTYAGSSKTTVLMEINSEGAWYNIPSDQKALVVQAVHSVLGQLCSPRFSRHWENLSLTGIPWEYLSPFTTIASEDLPCLEQLSFSNMALASEEGGLVPSPSVAQSGMIGASRIKSLAFQKVLAWGSLADFRLANWSGLTDLVLTDVVCLDPNTRLEMWGNEEIFAILSRCTRSLHSLRVHIPTPSHRPSHLLPISFPNLRTLAITQGGCNKNGASYLGGYLCSMHTPSLSSLEYAAYSGPDLRSGAITHPLLAFIRTSCSNISYLTHVKFEYNILKPDELNDFLGIIGWSGSNVTNLEMYPEKQGWGAVMSTQRAVFSSRVLHRFMPCSDDQSQVLFPRLEEFKCSLARPDEFNDKDLLLFIRHRLPIHHSDRYQARRPFAKLDRVSVDFVNSRTVDVLEEVRRLSAGSSSIAIQITYPKFIR